MWSMKPAKRLLVAEDDDGTRSGLAAILREEGYIVDEAADGQIAWTKFCEVPADLVLTDLDMPNVGGGELIGKIRAQYPRLPIAVLSAEDPLDLGRRCVGLNADRFFSKPIKLDEILDFVEAHTQDVAS